MKIRRSIYVLFAMLALIIPISLYRAIFVTDASDELLSAVSIVYNILISVFIILTFAFSLFTDDFPRSYTEGRSRLLGVVTMLFAASMGYMSVLGLLNSDYSEFDGTPGKAVSIIGILSLLSLMFYLVTYFRGQNIVSAAALVPIFPALWYGLRLVLYFLESASMADIQEQLPIIAMCCSFTIFLLTLGKLFSCDNSNSTKWTFASGCCGVLATAIYAVNSFAESGVSLSILATSPITVDIAMSLFAIGSLFHISKPAEYFDEEHWDDYFYETYDLPKPNLVIHSLDDELEDDTVLDDDLDDEPYIPVNSSISSHPYQQHEQAAPVQQQPVQQPYAANPAAYPPPQPVPYPVYPAYYPGYQGYQGYQGAPYPTYTYPVPTMPPQGYEYYPKPAMEYYDPYDAAAQQYQYERRRTELQSRELEKLTGEIDDSLAQLQAQTPPPQRTSNEYIPVSPDERFSEPAKRPTRRNLRLDSEYSRQGERLTDHLADLEREASQRDDEYYDSPEDDEYTYEYYYPSDNQIHYNTDRFNPNK